MELLWLADFLSCWLSAWRFSSSLSSLLILFSCMEWSSLWGTDVFSRVEDSRLDLCWVLSLLTYYSRF